MVEVADDGDAPRIGRPEREQHALDALMRRQLGAEPLVELAVCALQQQIIVDRPERGAEGIGVIDDLDAADAGDFQPVGGAGARPGDQALEEIALAAGQFDKSAADARRGANPDRVGHEGPDDPAGLGLVGAEDRKRVLLTRRRNGVDVFLPCAP